MLPVSHKCNNPTLKYLKMKMYMLKRLLISFMILTMCYSCEKEKLTSEDNPVDPNNLKISGYVFDELGNRQERINISLNDGKTASTNNEGYFEVSGLLSGTYILTAENLLTNTSFSLLTDTIVIDSNNFEYDSIMLPTPVMLHQPSDIKPSSISLSWSGGTQDSFREYRLYIGGEVLHDENGTLVYIGTNKTDTSYTISRENFNNAGGTISPNASYFFRVYIYDSYGKISGSNILKVITPSWDTTNFTTHYTLELETNFAGAKPIKGIDWDDNENLWIFYYNETGYINGVYHGNGELVNYNYKDNILLDTVIISEFDQSPSGIAFDNTVIWVQMQSFQGRLVAFDIETGQQTATMMLSNNMSYLSDIAKTQDGFGVLWNFHDYELINNQGGIQVIGKTPFDAYYAMVVSLGIAERNHEYWIGCSNSSEIAIMDQIGNHIGIVETGLSQTLGYGGNLRLAIRNNKLVIALDSQIYIYNIINLE